MSIDTKKGLLPQGSSPFFSEGRFLLFTFTEPGIVAAVTDYLEALLGDSETLDSAASVAMLQQWLQEYLP